MRTNENRMKERSSRPCRLWLGMFVAVVGLASAAPAQNNLGTEQLRHRSGKPQHHLGGQRDDQPGSF